MKKNPLLLTLAVSALAPNAMAQVDATTKIANPGFEEGEVNWDVEGFTVTDKATEGGLVVDAKFLKLTPAQTGAKLNGLVTQKIVGLPKGKYNLKVEVADDADATNDEEHYMVAGADKTTLVKVTETFEIEVGDDGVLVIGYEAKEVDATFIGIDNFKLEVSKTVIDPIKEALTHNLAVAIAKANSIEDKNISDILVKASKISDEIVNFDFADYQDWVENEEESKLFTDIKALENDLVAAVENKVQYDRAMEAYAKVSLDTLEANYTAVTTADSISDEYKAAAKVVYEKAIAAHKELGDNIKSSYYEKGTAATDFSDENIKNKIDLLNKTISDAAVAIKSGNTNDVAYAYVSGEVNAAKQYFIAQSDTLYANLSGSYQAVYGDWFAEASVKLRNIYKDVLNVEAENKISREKKECEANKAGYIDRLVDAKAEMADVVEEYVTKANAQKEVYAEYAGYVTGLETSLEKEMAKTKEEQFKEDEAAINDAINTLLANLDVADKDHAIDSVYKATFKKDSLAITEDIAKLGNYIAWDNLYRADKAEIAEFKTALENAKASVAKLKQGDYSAADMYPGTVKAIQDSIDKWTIAYEIRKEYTEYVFNPDSAGVGIAIEKYFTDAETTFKAYEVASGKLAEYKTAVDSLTKKATDGSVTIDGTINAQAKTYKAYIADCENVIKEAEGLIDIALKERDAKHIEAVNNLKTDFDVADVNSKTANYDKCSDDWNAKLDEAAWTRIKSECTACVTAVTSVLPAEKYDSYTNRIIYGLKAGDLEQKRVDILTEIGTINGMIGETSGKVDSKELSVAEALSLLTTVLKDAEAVKAKADTLAAEAKAAAEKVKAETDEKTRVDGLITESLDYQLNGKKDTDKTKEIKSVIDLNEDKTDEIDKYFTDSVAKLNVRIETLRAAVQTSRDNETLVSHCQKIEETVEGKVVSKKGYNEQITDLATEIQALRKKANETTANLKAKDEMVTYYTTGVKVGEDIIGVDSILKKTQEDVDKVYSDLGEAYKWTNSQDHYNGVIADLKTEFGKIKESIDTVYVKQEAVAKKESLIKEIDAVVGEATGLKAKVEANEAAYKDQLDSVAVVEKKWKKAYDYIIENAELGNTLQQSLDTLAAVQLELKNGREVIEDSHTKGESAAKTGSLLPAFGSCSNKIDAVKNGWGGAYEKEVSDYNYKIKEEFDKQYNALSKAYADAVQYIDKMNKTEWAVNTDVVDTLKAITEGPDGLYSYAAKIRDLKAKAQTAYEKAVPPIVFEEGEGFIDEAKEMQANVEGKFAQYESTLNKHAKNACEKEFANASNALEKAMNEVAKDLFGVVDGTYPSEGAFTPIKADLDKALADSASYAFALKYEEVMKTINGIEDRIPGAKEEDAKTCFNDQWNYLKDLSLKEADAIAQFNGMNGTVGAFNQDYKDYVANSLSAAQTRYEDLQEGYYNEMTTTRVDKDGQSEETLKALLANFELVDREVGKDKDGNALFDTHSAKYWEASDENDAWNVNDESYNYMKLQVGTVIGKLDTLDMFRLPLVATNAVQGTIDEYAKAIADVQDTIEVAHKEVRSNVVKDKVVGELKAIASNITNSYANVLDKENSAIQSQLVTLRFEYSLAEAVEIDSIDVEKNFKDSIDAYEAEATLIFNDFKTGTVDKDGKPVMGADGKNVCITADSAQVAYLNLEEKIGLTRKALAEIYNETLYKQIYDDLIVGVDSVQDLFNDEKALFNDCHSSVKAKFEDKVKALDETLAGIVAAINARNEANTLMVYAENLTADIQKVAKNIAALAKDIAVEEAKYDVNDKNYKRLNDELDKFEADVENLSATLHSYEYLTYESDYAEAQLDAINAGLIKLSDTIAFDRDVLVEINNAVDVDNNKTTFLTDESTNSCNDTKNETKTKWFENTVNDMLITYSYNNAVAVLNNRDALRRNGAVVFNDSRLYTKEDSEMLVDVHNNVIWPALQNISTYLSDAKRGHVYYDINGDKIYDKDGNWTGKDVKFMEAYVEVMAAIEVLTPKLNEWVKNVNDLKYVLGDVDHNKLVNVNDYITVRNMVLGIITKETEGINSAAFYAADVDGNGKIDITDLTQVADNIMTGKPFGSYAARSLATANQNNSDAISAVVNGTGRHQQLVISLNNEMNYVGAQMDIVLPAGVKVVGESLADRAASHELFSNDVNGAHRVVISDINNNEFQNNEQALLVIDLEVSADFEGGALEINDAIFTTANGRGYTLKAAIGGGETGITNLTVTEKAASRVYSIGGQMMNTLRKGINIIVNSDGTAKKVVNK